MKSPNPAPARTRTVRRIALSLAAACLLLLLVATALTSHQQAAAAAQNTAQVIVQFDDTASNIHSVTFTDPISGLRALQLAGFDVITHSSSFGISVCSIEHVGCPADNCFCNPSKFWGYARWAGATWQPYMVGADSSVISQTGAIEGWRWGEFGSAQTSAPVSVAVANGLAWLSSQQVITNGSYGNVGGSLETMISIGANGAHAAAWQRTADGPTLEGAVLGGAATYSKQGAAQAGKLSAGLAAANACLPAGVVAPSAYYSPTINAYSRNSGDNAWAMLGIAARGETVPAAALAAMKAAAQANGGWEWGVGWGVDTNATSLAVQALIANGEPPTSTAIISALIYLKSAQGADGGFPYAAGGNATSDSNSTAYVVQALVAAGQNPAGAAWQSGGKNPLDFLRARQLANGAFEWQAGKGANLLATQQAIPALLGQANPIAIGAPAACPATSLPLVKTVE